MIQIERLAATRILFNVSDVGEVELEQLQSRHQWRSGIYSGLPLGSQIKENRSFVRSGGVPHGPGRLLPAFHVINYTAK